MHNSLCKFPLRAGQKRNTVRVGHLQGVRVDGRYNAVDDGFGGPGIIPARRASLRIWGAEMIKIKSFCGILKLSQLIDKRVGIQPYIRISDRTIFGHIMNQRDIIGESQW